MKDVASVTMTLMGMIMRAISDIVSFSCSKPVGGRSPEGRRGGSREDTRGKGNVNYNPGGSVDTANEIGEYLIPKGILTYLQDKAGNRKDYNCSGDSTWDGPLVLLVNENSASASEIIAGAVKDYGTGKLVGTKTFGKGIVQTTTTLTDGSSVKYTFAKYYTPNGDNIHGKGIEPDVEVELDSINSEQGYSIETDNQLKKAMEVLDEQAK